ncbi:MAG: DUF4398 domain-containing protein [Polyangiales bacterium]
MRRGNELRRRAAWLVIGAVLAAAACGGGAPPSERLVTAEAAIRGARELGAQSSPPRAALHLQLAQEQVEKAKRYIADGEHERAELALRQAQADAELAIALARNEEMKQKADATRAKVDRLKQGKPL